MTLSDFDLTKRVQSRTIDYNLNNFSETFFQESEQNWEKTYATHLSVNLTLVAHLCVPTV